MHQNEKKNFLLKFDLLKLTLRDRKKIKIRGKSTYLCACIKDDCDEVIIHSIFRIHLKVYDFHFL